MIDADVKADLLEPVWEHYGGRILNSSGNGWRSATCTFHDDKHPSAQVNLREGVWSCLACGRSGDVFNLVQQHEDIPFVEAKQIVAELTGTDVAFNSSTQPRKGRAQPYKPAWL